MGALKRLGDNFDEQLGRLMVLNSGRVRRVLASRSRNSKSAVILGRVCARWYAVTRSFPALWTTVDVIYPTRAATSILKLCLKYSAASAIAHLSDWSEIRPFRPVQTNQTLRQVVCFLQVLARVQSNFSGTSPFRRRQFRPNRPCTVARTDIIQVIHRP